MLFHSSCPQWDKKSGPVPRLRLRPQDRGNEALCTRTYKCERCGDQVHIDMDWKEGAVPEERARLD
jgi:hypothetical protein